MEVDTDSYHKNGYLLVKGIFDDEMVGNIIDELSELAAREGEFEEGSFIYEDNHKEIRKLSDNPLDWIRKIDYFAMRKSSLLMKIFQDGRSDISQICARLIGEDRLRLIFLSTFAKPARGGAEIPWHQDQGLWDLWMPNTISAWVALNRTTDENGLLQVVPGSHLWGIAPHRMYPGKIHESINIADYPEAQPVKVYMEPGDVIFFSGRTWHYSEPNHSDHRRLGMPVVYTGEDVLKEALACNEWVESKLVTEGNMAPLPLTRERCLFYHESPEIYIGM
jgi:phytanoyl-CoA hydroxylase